MSENLPVVFQDGSVAVDASGSSDPIRNKHAEKGIFRLDITAATALTTLDVDIEWQEPGTGAWITLFSFTQQVAVGSEAIVYGDIVADEFLPGNLRASWALVGTDVTFTVVADMR